MPAMWIILIAALQAATDGLVQGEPATGSLQGTALWSKPKPRDPTCVPESLVRKIAESGISQELPDLLVVKFAVLADGSLTRFQIVEGQTSEGAARIVWSALQACAFDAGRDPQGVPTRAWLQVPLRFQDPPPPRRPTGTELSGMGLGILAACFATGWWLGRRLGLFGPTAPRRTDLDQRSYHVRRSTRALFLLDFGFMFPAGLFVAVVSVLVGRPWWKWVPVAFSAVTLGVPLAVLLLQVRRDDARRLAGLPPGPTFGDRYYGSPGVASHFRKTGWVPLGTWLLVLGFTSAAWQLPAHVLLERLLKSNTAILNGQIWRLWTVALVHADARHLLANLSALLPLGLLLDRLAGARAFLLVFLSGTAVGSLVSVLLVPTDSVGASGGVLALVGALATFGWRQRSTITDTMRKVLLWEAILTVVLNLALPILLPYIDWAAHLGGFAAGMALGWWLQPSAGFLKALVPPDAQLGPRAQATPTVGLSSG